MSARPPNSAIISRPMLVLPRAVALPRMLEKIEAELADEKTAAAEKWRLRPRAELIRPLLTPQVSPIKR
jgi:hypothetical protein